MATIAAQSIKLAGAKITYTAAAAGGDKFATTGRTMFRVVNGGGSPIDVTFDSVRLSNYGTDVNPTKSVPAGETWEFGPFPKTRFEGTDGLVAVTYSDVTSVTVAVVELDADGI